MSQLRQRMVEEMQLRRFAEATQTAYLHWVSELAKYYHKSPEQVSREEVRSWFLYLTNERKLSRSSVTVALCGIKFFYETVSKSKMTKSFFVTERVIRASGAPPLSPLRSSSVVSCSMSCPKALSRCVTLGYSLQAIGTGSNSLRCCLPLPLRRYPCLPQKPHSLHKPPAKRSLARVVVSL